MSDDEKNLDREEWNDAHAHDRKTLDPSEPPMHELTMLTDQLTLGKLLSLGREIWGPPPVGRSTTNTLPSIVVRLSVTVGDLARIARQYGDVHWDVIQGELPGRVNARMEIKKELGNVILSVIRWCDDLGFNPAECVALAVKAQHDFVTSKKPR